MIQVISTIEMALLTPVIMITGISYLKMIERVLRMNVLGLNREGKEKIEVV